MTQDRAKVKIPEGVQLRLKVLPKKTVKKNIEI